MAGLRRSHPRRSIRYFLRTMRGPGRWSMDIAPSQERYGDESVDKPDSVGRCRPGDHPSATTVASGLVRSTRRLGRAALERLRRRVRVLLILLQVGFTKPSQSPGMLVVCYTAVS